MEDTAGHGPPQPADDGLRHTLSVSEVAAQLLAAGVPRSHRHISRLCQAGLFDAKKLPGGSGPEYFIAPDSVSKAIGDLQAMQERKGRRSPPQPATSDHGAVEKPSNDSTDTARHGALKPAVSDKQESQKGSETEPAVARHGVPELDVYEHPYVKKLEERVEKLELKYEAQVRRTEEIQLNSQKQIIELQRMTAIGQSETLADFMLKAKEWILGQGSPTEKNEVNPPVA